MNLYVIYGHPNDFPDYYVVRVHTVPGGVTGIYGLFNTLEDARKFLPYGLHRIPRAEGDQEQILETWV